MHKTYINRIEKINKLIIKALLNKSRGVKNEKEDINFNYSSNGCDNGAQWLREKDRKQGCN